MSIPSDVFEPFKISEENVLHSNWENSTNNIFGFLGGRRQVRVLVKDDGDIQIQIVAQKAGDRFISFLESIFGIKDEDRGVYATPYANAKLDVEEFKNKFPKETFKDHEKKDIQGIISQNPSIREITTSIVDYIKIFQEALQSDQIAKQERNLQLMRAANSRIEILDNFKNQIKEFPDFEIALENIQINLRKAQASFMQERDEKGVENLEDVIQQTDKDFHQLKDKFKQKEQPFWEKYNDFLEEMVTAPAEFQDKVKIFISGFRKQNKTIEEKEKALESFKKELEQAKYSEAFQRKKRYVEVFHERFVENLSKAIPNDPVIHEQFNAVMQQRNQALASLLPSNTSQNLAEIASLEVIKETEKVDQKLLEIVNKTKGQGLEAWLRTASEELRSGKSDPEIKAVVKLLADSAAALINSKMRVLAEMREGLKGHTEEETEIQRRIFDVFSYQLSPEEQTDQMSLETLASRASVVSREIKTAREIFDALQNYMPFINIT